MWPSGRRLGSQAMSQWVCRDRAHGGEVSRGAYGWGGKAKGCRLQRI